MTTYNTRINNKANIDTIINKCVDYENYIKNQLEYILTTSDDVNDNSGYKNMIFRKYINNIRNLYKIKSVSSSFDTTNNSNGYLNELNMKISAAEQMVVLIDLFKPIFDNASSKIDDVDQPYNRIGITERMFMSASVLPPTYDDDIKFTIRDGKVIGQWVNQSVCVILIRTLLTNLLMHLLMHLRNMIFEAMRIVCKLQLINIINNFRMVMLFFNVI